jgi:CO/xanthine dehydrogenase FAD-binding subunit
MIPFDFEYLRPESLAEAITSYQQLHQEGLKPIYYAGGTEVVTFCRAGRMQPGAVIDVKRIPECRMLAMDSDVMICGAALPLNAIITWNRFPLLSEVAQVVADHTVRNRLTLGGNIAGHLPYRETVLPLLLTDAVMQTAGPQGERHIPIQDIFQKRLMLVEGELLVQIQVPKHHLAASTWYQRKTKHSRIDYPIASAAFLKDKEQIRMAIGGVSEFPFRSVELETMLNDTGTSTVVRAAQIVSNLPFPVANTHRASAEYRLMLLERMLVEALEKM